jgi:hypothetical protein
MRWRRWSEERGKVKGWGSKTTGEWMWAVDGVPRRAVPLAVEGDMPVYE